MNHLLFHNIHSGDKKQLHFIYDAISKEFISAGNFGKVAYKEFKDSWGQIQLISFELNEDIEISFLTEAENIFLNYCIQGCLFQMNDSEPEILAQTQYRIQYSKTKSCYLYTIKPTGKRQYLFFNLALSYSYPSLLITKSASSTIEFQKSVFEILSEIKKERPDGRRLRVFADLLLLESLEQYEHHRLEMHDQKPWNPEQRMVFLMAETIILGMDEAWTLNKLASSQHLNPNKLKSIFKKYMGIPATAFKISVRMQKARELLIDSTLHIQEISAQVGYPNPAQFSTIFKRKMGCSPSQLRKRSINSRENGLPPTV